MSKLIEWAKWSGAKLAFLAGAICFIAGWCFSKIAHGLMWLGGRTDQELLDALEDAGMGIALLHDDDEHWFVVGDGTQEVVTDGPKPFATTFIVEDMPLAGRTVRQAINLWLDAEDD